MQASEHKTMEKRPLKLTKKDIDNAPYGTGWWTITGTVEGLRLRCSKGKKVFYLRRRVEGLASQRDYRVCAWLDGLTVHQVKDLAMQKAAEIAQGVDPVKERRNALARGTTLEDIYNQYIQARTQGKRALKPGSIEQIRYTWKHLEKWSNKPMTAITRGDVRQLHGDMSRKSTRNADKVVQLLSQLYRYAMEVIRADDDNPVILYNPADTISNLGLLNGLPRRTGKLPEEKFKVWFDTVLGIQPKGFTHDPEIIADLLQFTLLTGLRRNEAAMLTWDNVDMVGRTFTIVENKVARPFSIPLSDYLVDILQRRKERATCQYCFPCGKDGGPLTNWRHWERYIEKHTGVKCTPHDYRRTFITTAESLDLSAYVVKALVNHRLPKADVTAGYIIMEAERLRAPMQKITDYMLRLGGVRKGGDVVPLKKKVG